MKIARQQVFGYNGIKAQSLLGADKYGIKQTNETRGPYQRAARIIFGDISRIPGDRVRAL
ncbi:hypothetical protein D3C86_1956200 [compost metagenome]